MKKLSTLFGCLLIALTATLVDAQTSHDSFRIGAKTIRIPSPAGFVNGHPKIPQVAAQVKAFEEPDGRTLTMHIPQSIARKVIAGERVESLPFYAKIAVNKEMDNIDVTPTMLGEYANLLERDFEKLVDEELPKTIVNGNKSLTEYLGKNMDAVISRPLNLGTIDRRPDVYSVMFVTVVQHPGKTMPMISVMSHVVVQKRLLYVNIYKEFSTDKDIETLRDFARKWADDILAANN